MSVDIRKELQAGEARATKRRRQSDTRRRTSLALRWLDATHVASRKKNAKVVNPAGDVND
ncbi:hypothetical protein N7493_003666 [Penicillium malachiteum]|uniref:Uncharacterized protein n=1 Tax=Penicillium malachiteum TaxID=1324776 RepID=A0AAD6MXT1_9EURO|nr:hypothetical protein N7493_003666 [Penicillium malachiteum]